MKTLRTRCILCAAVAAALAVGVAAAGARPVGAPSAKAGGTLVIGLAEEPDALDPTLARTFVGRIVFMHLCEKLYDLNAKLQIVPQLAASLPEVSSDKLTVTIKLRSGIKFNDGTSLDAEAVKKSLERHIKLPRSARASELSPVDSIDVVGPLTVRLKLKQPYSPLTAQLADRAGMILAPKAIDELGDRFATNPVCVGPFTYKERVAQDHITLTKSQFYYARNKVSLDQIVFRTINDPSARTQNLRAGDIQVLDRAQATDLPALNADKNVKMLKAASIGYQGITFNIGNKNGIGKPFENVGTPIARSQFLRTAFDLALNRKLINKVVFGGTTQPGCYPLSPVSPWYATTKGLDCDLDGNVPLAKKLVAASKIDTPINLRLTIGTDPVAARLGQTIQAMEKEVGFNVTLEPTEFTTALNRQDRGQYEGFAVGWSGRVDPDGNIYQFVHSKGSLNNDGFSTPRLDLLLDNARKATTEKARLKLYAAAMKIIHSQRPLVYLWHPVNRDGVSAKVKGVQLFGDGLVRAQYAAYK